MQSKKNENRNYKPGKYDEKLIAYLSENIEKIWNNSKAKIWCLFLEDKLTKAWQWIDRKLNALPIYVNIFIRFSIASFIIVNLIIIPAVLIFDTKFFYGHKFDSVSKKFVENVLSKGTIHVFPDTYFSNANIEFEEHILTAKETKDSVALTLFSYLNAINLLSQNRLADSRQELKSVFESSEKLWPKGNISAKRKLASLQGDILFYEGRLNESKSILKPLTVELVNFQNPYDEFNSYNILGQASFLEGSYAQAISYWKRAIEVDSLNKWHSIIIRELEPEKYGLSPYEVLPTIFSLGYAYQQLGESENATKFYNKALKESDSKLLSCFIKYRLSKLAGSENENIELLNKIIDEGTSELESLEDKEEELLKKLGLASSDHDALGLMVKENTGKESAFWLVRTREKLLFLHLLLAQVESDIGHSEKSSFHSDWVRINHRADFSPELNLYASSLSMLKTDSIKSSKFFEYTPVHSALNEVFAINRIGSLYNKRIYDHWQNQVVREFARWKRITILEIILIIVGVILPFIGIEAVKQYQLEKELKKTENLPEAESNVDRIPDSKFTIVQFGNREKFLIDSKDILLIKSINTDRKGYVEIYFNDFKFVQSEQVKETLSNCLKKLPNNLFAYANQSMIVNLVHVRHVLYGKVILYLPPHEVDIILKDKYAKDFESKLKIIRQ